MKYCPACSSQYSDDTLSFCLQDGTPLEGGAKQSTIDTVAFTNPETVEKLYKTDDFAAAPAGKTQKFQPYPKRPQMPAQKRRFPIVLAVAVPLFLFAAAAGVGGWVYLQSYENEANSRNEFGSPDAGNSAANAIAHPETTVREAVNATNVSDGLPSDAETVKSEINDFLNAWKASAESRNLAEHVSKYADKVDYLDTPRASIAVVRGETKKIFDAYEEIEIELSNVKIAAEANGNSATALFDKEWSYESGSNLVDGKAHTKLRFQKIDGQWKIVGEKFQKVYYIEN